MQVDTNMQSLLQQVLHSVATGTHPQAYVPTVLQSAGNLVGASSACFLLFDEPELYITVGDDVGYAQQVATFKLLADALPSGIHVNPRLPNGDSPPVAKSNYIIAPLYLPDSDAARGAVYLASSGRIQLSEVERAALESLVDISVIIAAHVESHAQRERAEQLARSILHSITDPLLVIDKDKRVLLLNPAAESVFALSAREAVGRTLSEVVRSDELMRLIDSSNEDMAEWVLEDEKTFVPRIEPVRDQHSDIEGWVLALRDITHFKRLNRNQNEFTRIVSHDLRSPLTSMQGFANMLELGLVGELNEKQAHFIDKILSGITQMTALVDNIQDAGRYDPETGFYDLSRSHCDLKEIVNRIVDNHLVPAEKQELKLSWFVDDNVPVINADMHMLERAITNLIDNAIKYTPNGGSVDVRVEKRDEQVVISVSDSGYGISPENQKHLFERHVRIPRQEHKKIKGSGLGLFIVRSVAQRHGGDAWVRSVEGEGSTFYMSIPLAGANLVGAEASQ